MSVVMTDAAAQQVKEQFNDLAAEFDNSRSEVRACATQMQSSCGEFGPVMEPGAAAFDMSWQDAFDFCGTAAALIAGNTNAMHVDLAALDRDASTSIVL